MDNVTRRDVIRGAAATGLVGVFVSGAELGAEEKGNQVAAKLEGKWKYQSYRPDLGSLAAVPNPQKFVPWSPPDKGVVTIDAGGTKGTLEFTGTNIKLGLKIQVTDGNPVRVSISAAMKLSETKQFTNELQGWLVPAELGQEVGTHNPFVVRGSIVQTSEDIVPKDKNPQPMYTTGFFVLEPMK